MNFREIERLIPCPFNPSHQILPLRMALHIVKCQKNHPDADVKVCPFNATHIVKVPLMQAHLMECPNRAIVERDMFIKSKYEQQLAEKRKQEAAQQAPVMIGGEDWDAEVAISTYNPQENIIHREITRKVPSGMGKAARRKWRQDEVERVQRLKDGLPINDMDWGQKTTTTGPPVQENEQLIKESNSVMQFKSARRPRIAANFGLAMETSGNVAQWTNGASADSGKEGLIERDNTLKQIIKSKRILEKRLLQINKLEKKDEGGYRMTWEERVKVGRKEETQLELEQLLEGIHLEDL